MNYIFVNLQTTYGSDFLFSTVFQGLLVSWSQGLLVHLLCISQFQVLPCTPAQLLGINCMPCQSWGWGISKLCVAQRSGICQPQGHPQAFGMHMYSFLNITKRRGFYHGNTSRFADWLICVDFMPAFLHCLINQKSGAILLKWHFCLVMKRNFCWSRIWL